MKPKEIVKGVYLVGNSDMTDPRDCSVYLLDCGELVLVDAGAGLSVDAIIKNIEGLGLNPENLSTIILTHLHIDHVGGAHEFRKRYGSRIIIHNLDAGGLEKGETTSTGASWYKVPFAPLAIDHKLFDDEETLQFGSHSVICLHTPEHTPGSISVYMVKDGKRILFGQDIHGPFLKESGANMSHWQRSMEKLLALKADILCEGHFGVFQPAAKVAGYIERYLDEYGV